MRYGRCYRIAPLMLLAAACSAQAADFDVVGGASTTSGLRWTAALFAGVAGTPPDDGHAHWAPVGSAGVIDSRDTDHDNLDQTVFLAAAGLRYGRPEGLFFSEQLAVTSTRTDALSSRFEFMTSLGWQHHRFVAMLRHISNAHLIGGGKNIGETMLLAGLRI